LALLQLLRHVATNLTLTITGKIATIVQRYPLTAEQQAQLTQELQQLFCSTQLAALRSVETTFQAALSEVQASLYPTPDLAGKSIRELKQIAKQRGVPYRNLTKAELVEAIALASQP